MAPPAPPRLWTTNGCPSSRCNPSAAMRPTRSGEPPRLQELEPLHAPRYASALHPFSGGTLLSFRHPSLGWLPFLLPSFQRRSLVQSFQDQEAAWGEIHLVRSQEIRG